MRQLSPNDKIVSCRNCGKPLPPASSYCPSCSQRFTTGKINFKDFVLELIDNFFSLDSRWFQTLKYVLVPGKLTKEFFLGKHKTYIHPIRIFLVVVAVFLYALSQDLFSSDDEKIFQDDSFKIRLYKNYILNELDSCFRPEIASNPPLRHQLDNILFKISHLNDTYPSQTSTKEKNQSKKNPKVVNDLDSETTDTIQKGKPQHTFYLDNGKTTYQLPIQEFKNTYVEDFIKKYNIQADTPQKYLIASLRRIKYKDDYEDTLHCKDLVRASDTLSYRTEWSDPLNISITLGNRQNKISLEDIRQLSINQITEKYHIGGFFDKLILKQMIKSNLDQKSFVSFLIGTILWILIVFIPFMALVMKLFYWKSKVYYIEHIVFLLHYHIAMLIMMTIAILLSVTMLEEIGWIFFSVYSFIILPYLGIKNFYRQRWLMTIFKASMIGFIYFCSLSFFLLLGLIIGFFVY